ncbi:hypothetical protein ATANTOWER_012355 [Ataeniobius toweri]|uniref:Uncharacterized protein n=1 Tax=Ataeniobius toweri TaxID=208326 RepID=A0ABU7AK86_9TELE|nr:hypothetical protein [Ataeniobius toweri]
MGIRCLHLVLMGWMKGRLTATVSSLQIMQLGISANLDICVCEESTTVSLFSTSDPCCQVEADGKCLLLTAAPPEVAD